MGNIMALSVVAMQQGMVSKNVTPVLFAFGFTSLVFLIKYLVQEVIMLVIQGTKEAEPKTFDDIKKVNLDELPKELANNKRSIYERLRRIKKEDFEFIVMFVFIAASYLISTSGASNYTFTSTSKSTESNVNTLIVWSDLSIANSVIGCLFIVAFFVLRVISLVMIFVQSKTLIQNIIRIVTFVYLALFGLFVLIMIFMFNFYVQVIVPSKVNA
ncbi:predicted protein [Naegleria gruberi]|uniref:Predicted protein n=1 Tax=Naegleria gruberi TaxID=5762 RepID=D2VSX4_NAEGR|nr:uncharacterized protein NAEGRDRAFT_72094 [Naegleria gruberi]EFC39979.1 predicted protein [Naegleria gruberi]|eukprot:XP_002672723.1 predicted protein [Naegleria gruberi strain NEG-M]